MYDAIESAQVLFFWSRELLSMIPMLRGCVVNPEQVTWHYIYLRAL